MLLKIKNGTRITIDGKEYEVFETSMDDVSREGVSNKVSFKARHDLDVVDVSFGYWTNAISENDLDGLRQMLGTG